MTDVAGRSLRTLPDGGPVASGKDLHQGGLPGHRTAEEHDGEIVELASAHLKVVTGLLPALAQIPGYLPDPLSKPLEDLGSQSHVPAADPVHARLQRLGFLLDRGNRRRRGPSPQSGSRDERQADTVSMRLRDLLSESAPDKDEGPAPSAARGGVRVTARSVEAKRLPSSNPGPVFNSLSERWGSLGQSRRLCRNRKVATRSLLSQGCIPKPRSSITGVDPSRLRAPSSSSARVVHSRTIATGASSALLEGPVPHQKRRQHGRYDQSGEQQENCPLRSLPGRRGGLLGRPHAVTENRHPVMTAIPVAMASTNATGMFSTPCRNDGESLEQNRRLCRNRKVATRSLTSSGGFSAAPG